MNIGHRSKRISRRRYSKEFVQRGSAQRLLKEARASKNITTRMSLEDLERARQLSAKRGLVYQTYMKMSLHEALDREEKSFATVELLGM